MTVDSTLLTLALELLYVYDPELDTSEGSPFRTQFLDPFLVRVGGSPLDTNFEAFCVSRLETEIEDIETAPYSAMRDLVVRAFVTLADPLRREIKGIKITQSMLNAASMTRGELNALLANYFTEIKEGNKTRGMVRMYFASPQSVTITPTTQFSTGGGLNFFPTNIQQITSTQMSFQQEGELYYFDILVEAENPGDSYNVDVDSINSVVGVVGVVRVTNAARFRDGLPEETNAEAVARTQNSITVRNLITERGAEFVLPENFPDIDLIQVIGMGDAEMTRDVIRATGPVSFADIPGGFHGFVSPDLGAGQYIHIGDMTDIYLYQPVPDLEDIDIEDLTDKGYRIFAGTHGFTQPGPATATFEDAYGFFQKRGILAGDILRVEEDEIEVLAVLSETQLVLDGTLAGGLFEETYEVVRRVVGQVTVPLYDLVAVENGSVVYTTAGDPVEPIPGSATNAPLRDGLGVLVAKTDNVSSENVQLPLLHVTTVEFLDPLTKEALGQFIPMRDLLETVATADFAGGGVGTYAQGTVRLFFRNAVNAWVSYYDTRFSAGGRAYRPVQQVVAAGVARVDDLNSQEVILTGDFTATIAVGDRIEVLGSILVVMGVSYSAPDTTITVREDLNDYFGGTFSGEDVESHAGILEANMSLDASTHLYYVDFDVEDVITGSAGNQLAGTVFAAAGVISEGWTLRTTYASLSFSTRELPYFQVSEWVNDTTRLGITFTAPAIRVSYDYASSLAEIQTFADAPANRIVAEDVLIRHFIPCYVRASFEVEGTDAVSAKATIVERINALDPANDLEASDLVQGFEHVVLPVTLTGVVQSEARVWSGAYSQDALVSSRVQHFIADDDFITVTLL